MQCATYHPNRHSTKKPVDSGPTPYGNMGGINAWDPIKRTFTGIMMFQMDGEAEAEAAAAAEGQIYRDEEHGVTILSHLPKWRMPMRVPYPGGKPVRSAVETTTKLDSNEGKYEQYMKVYEYEVDTGKVVGISWDSVFDTDTLPMQLAFMYQ